MLEYAHSKWAGNEWSIPRPASNRHGFLAPGIKQQTGFKVERLKLNRCCLDYRDLHGNAGGRESFVDRYHQKSLFMLLFIVYDCIVYELIAVIRLFPAYQLTIETCTGTRTDRSILSLAWSCARRQHIGNLIIGNWGENDTFFALFQEIVGPKPPGIHIHGNVFTCPPCCRVCGTDHRRPPG